MFTDVFSAVKLTIKYNNGNINICQRCSCFFLQHRITRNGKMEQHVVMQRQYQSHNLIICNKCHVLP